MKLSDAPSKIVGLAFGEGTFDLIHGVSPVKVKFALLNKDGAAVGFIEISHGWSEKALQALKTCTEALEEDAMRHIFEVTQTPETSEANKVAVEPQQF